MNYVPGTQWGRPEQYGWGQPQPGLILSFHRLFVGTGALIHVSQGDSNITRVASHSVRTT